MNLKYGHLKGIKTLKNHNIEVGFSRINYPIKLYDVP